MLLIKVGGGEKINWDYIFEDLVTLSKKEKIILVHGASKIRDQIALKMGQPTKTVVSPSGISSVYTDERAIEIFLMVYAGLINKKIVAKANSFGLNAIGLTGVDGNLWQAKRKKDILVKKNDKIKLLKNNLTGRVEKINTDLLKLLLDKNYLPVITPPAISSEHEIVNVDGDWGAAQTAIQMNPSARLPSGTWSADGKKIIYLFEAPGLLADFKDNNSLIKQIDKNKLEEFLQCAEGRMKKKIMGAKKAIDGGIKEIYFGDGRVKNPIINLLKGNGTVIS